MNSDFYNRATEQGLLDAEFQETPTSIKVMLGPRSCGKSALVKQYLRQKKLNDTVCYINCRRGDAITPTELATTLLQEGIPAVIGRLPDDYALLGDAGSFLAKLMALVAEVSTTVNLGGLPEGVKIKPADILQKLAAVSAKPPDKLMPPSSIKLIVSAYKEVLAAWGKCRSDGRLPATDLQWPVLILDEANRLTAWSGKYDDELKALLDFFVDTVKADNSAHIMLMTSEYAYQDWLNNSEFMCYRLYSLATTHHAEFSIATAAAALIKYAPFGELFMACWRPYSSLYS